MAIIVIIVIIFLFLLLINKKREHFDLSYNLTHFPWVGRFHNENLIGITYARNLYDCKSRCNKMDSCYGVSYNSLSNDCRLYNQTTDATFDPRYLSWRNFWRTIY